MKQILQAHFSGESLKAKVFRGGALLGGGSTAEQLFRFGRNMVLTRVLAPQAFGTMAIVMSTTAILESFLDVGARDALIQNPRGSEKEYVGAAWWLSVGRASGIYFVLFLLAPWAGRFYGNSELGGLMRVAAIGLLLEGVMSPRAYVSMKEMKFKKWMIVNHGGAICGVLITLILGFLIRDVWALAIGFVSEHAARCILSYALCPFAPPLRWDGAAIRELLGFSKGVFGLSILNLVFVRADIFVLAKLYSPAQLGLYAMAVYLIQTPTGFIVNLLRQTLMPTFSHIQNDSPRINRILLQVTGVILLVGMPALVFVYFCGHSLLTLVYGARYSAASAALIVASCVALLNVVNNQVTTVFYAKGLPQLHRGCVLIMAILMIFMIYPFAKWFGMVGGQWACLVAIVVGCLFQIDRVRRVTGVDLSPYRKSFFVSAAISLSAVAVCLMARSLGSMSKPLPTLFFGGVGCLVAYGLAFAVLLRGRTDSSLSL
jgi:O-antigen/teichoic acid export membrane protein